MIIGGVVFALAGLVLGINLLWIIGLVLIIVGVILALSGRVLY